MTPPKRDDQPARTYLLVSSKTGPLARAELEGGADGIDLQLLITDGDPEEVVGAEVVQAVPMDDRLPMRMGRIVRHRGARIVLEPLKGLMTDARKNLRMPVSFESLIYFQGGGRATIRALNLSCGGIAFYAAERLELGERFEVVVPITAVDPSVVMAELLRIDPSDGPMHLYAAKFVDLIPEEEHRLREAVFHAQVRRGKAISARK